MDGRSITRPTWIGWLMRVCDSPALCGTTDLLPSRAAILTGKAPARLHLTTYLLGRPDCISQKLLHPVINQHLLLEEKRSGNIAGCYATACIGKWHLGGEGFSQATRALIIIMLEMR